MNLVTPRDRVRVDTGPQGTIKHRDHWDGRTDAKILPGTVRYRAQPKPSQWLAFLELEAATAERREAAMSGSDEAVRRADYRLRQARARFDKVGMGQKIVEAIQ